MAALTRYPQEIVFKSQVDFYSFAAGTVFRVIYDINTAPLFALSDCYGKPSIAYLTIDEINKLAGFDLANLMISPNGGNHD